MRCPARRPRRLAGRIRRDLVRGKFIGSRELARPFGREQGPRARGLDVHHDLAPGREGASADQRLHVGVAQLQRLAHAGGVVLQGAQNAAVARRLCHQLGHLLESHGRSI